MLAAVGLAMLITAVVLFPARLELRSLAITVGVWSLLQLGIGIGLFLKTDGQVAALQTQLAPSKEPEVQRMEKVQKNFVVLEAVWVVMIVVGAIVAWRLKENTAVCGVALGIVINAAVLLAFDIVAERRGAIYLAALKV